MSAFPFLVRLVRLRTHRRSRADQEGSSEQFCFVILRGRLPGVLFSALRLYVSTHRFQRGAARTPDKVRSAPKQRLSVERRRVIGKPAAGTQDNPGRMVKQKAGLNREILSAELSMAHHMLAYKAVEAGTRLHVSNTRQLKPSQRCAMCWGIVAKTLAQRMHVCTHCGHTAQRDQNAASVVLIDAHTPGTGVAARPKPLARRRAKSKSETRETPATASQDA
jgi:hypothetical protein